MIAKYCPECGQDNLIYYNERKQYFFKCPKCQKWLAIGEYRSWEVEYIERKIDQMDRMALLNKKEVDE